MAPRRRRGKSSAVTQSAQLNTGSGTNSVITSSPSQPTSKSEDSALVPSPQQNSQSKITNESDSITIPSVPENESKMADTAVATQKFSTEDESTHTTENSPNRREELTKCLEEARQKLQQKGADKEYFTIADVTMQVCMDFVKWAVMDVAIQFKRQAFLALESERRLSMYSNHSKISRSKELTDGTSEVKKGESDKYGSALLFSEKGVTVECSSCLAAVSAVRYAQHFEKCSGRGGRMSSRAASARMRASVERSEKDFNTDLDEHTTRKRRNLSSNQGYNPPADGNGFSKRRRSSPATSGGSGAVSPNSTGRGGLPPSGRNRGAS